MIPTALLRLRLLVDEYGRAVVLALVVASVVSVAAAGWVATTPETTRTTERTDVQRVSADVHSSALVTANDSVWERGTRLENKSTYFADVSPHLRLRTVTRVPEGRPVDVTERLEVVVTASRGGSAFYTDRTVLYSANRTVSNGTVTSSAEINVSEFRERLRSLRGEFSSVADLSTSVRYRVRYDTGEYEGQLSTSSPLVTRGNAYWIGGSLSDERQHSRTRTSILESTNTSLVRSLGALGVLGFVAAGVVWVYARREVDRDELVFELQSRRLSEWISRGELPDTLDAESLRVESLRDVVDVGIDTGKRVIYDERHDVYAVLDDVVYYYSEDGPWPERRDIEVDGNGSPSNGDETPDSERESDFDFRAFEAGSEE